MKYVEVFVGQRWTRWAAAGAIGALGLGAAAAQGGGGAAHGARLGAPARGPSSAVSAGTPTHPALEDPCAPAWLPTFGGKPGTNDYVLALAVHDDGSGSALYVAGDFTGAGGVVANHIARWDGSGWAALGSGLNGAVNALATFDDGNGPALYAGGNFTTAGGVAASRIAMWDGASWAALGSGLNIAVNALATFDDGNGPALYAGGNFTTAGGVAASRIAKWDGSSWAALGSGLNGVVNALATFDDGNGPALYVGGGFTTAGGGAASRIARWDGASWTALGNGLNNTVFDLSTYDDGGGQALFAGGAFTTAGAVAASRIAKWDGQAWSALGGGAGSSVFALTVHDDGVDSALYAAGLFSSVDSVFAPHVARWNGVSWSALDGGLNDVVYALGTYDDGSGEALFSGGGFYLSGANLDGVPARHIARWKDGLWSALGDGPSSSPIALEVLDDGSGPALYAAGCGTGYRDGFSHAGGIALDGFGKWDGSSWSPMSAGILNGSCINAITVFDDGNGPALYAGGGITTPSGFANVVKWGGSSWSPLGPEMDAQVATLAAFDDGAGAALYAGGFFDAAAGVTLNSVARWNGSSWVALGSGMGPSISHVEALTVFDDGGGAALYAGGFFTTAGGVVANGIAKWDGASWSPLGSGTNGVVTSLTVFDDGNGPALYASGNFTTAGGVSANRIARWNGTSWSALGSGMNGLVWDTENFDDGSGHPALYACGDFTTAGGGAANRIARWNGSAWSPLGSGMNAAVEQLTAHEGSAGPALFAGGSFSSAIDSGDSHIARWAVEQVVLDFDLEDDFTTPLANGQDLSSPPEFGHLVSISSSGPNAGAAIFDSTPGGPNDPSQDRDLLVGSGNLVILQTNESTSQTVPGYFNRPNDDEDGGSLVFDFVAPVALWNLALVDIDAGADELTRVVLEDVGHRTRTYTVPPGWTGDRLVDGTSARTTLDLTTLEPQAGFLGNATATEMPGFDHLSVKRLEVHLGSSGAIDDLRWCLPEAPDLSHGPRAAEATAPGGPPLLR